MKRRLSLRALDPRRLSLRWQLSLAMMLVLSASLLIAVGVVLRNAREALAEQVQASLTATTSSLDATLDLLRRAPPEQTLPAMIDWIASQAGNRDLCVALSSGPIADAVDVRCPKHRSVVLSAPDWFARGAVAQPQVERRRLLLAGAPYTVLLVADPVPELNESWADTRELLQLMVLMAFSANALILLLVTLALSPLQAATRALARLHEGDFDVRLPATETSDLRQLLDGLQRLSRRLASSADENRRLLLKNLDLQEEERRLMAHELHDEIGQHVAAIEMATIMLSYGPAETAQEPQPSLKRIRDSVAEIHQLSRRMIRRLRPAALDTLGLVDGLQALMLQWRGSENGPKLIDEIDPRCDRVDAYTATHLYRIVQEALSNAMRHAQADQIQVQLLIVRQECRLRVADDGHGFDPEIRSAGLGLTGMRERVRALGGEMLINTAVDAGCCLQIRLPLRAAARPGTPESTAPKLRQGIAASELEA